MRLSEARREFDLRMYYWHTSEFEKEIDSGFPNLCLFKSGTGWKLYRFMQQLKLSDQMLLAHGRLKLAYRTDLEALGVALTEEEQSLAETFRQFALQPPSQDLESLSRQEAGGKLKFASKHKLRKLAVAKFIATYGSQCVDMKIGPEWDPQFHIRCAGWIVNTQLVFGPRQGLAWYRHVIESEARVQHRNDPKLTVPAVLLSSGVAWLVYRWEDVFDADVEMVSKAVIKHAGFFLEAAPRVLKGLELDTIVL